MNRWSILCLFTLCLAWLCIKPCVYTGPGRAWSHLHSVFVTLNIYYIDVKEYRPTYLYIEGYIEGTELPVLDVADTHFVSPLGSSSPKSTTLHVNVHGISKKKKQSNKPYEPVRFPGEIRYTSWSTSKELHFRRCWNLRCLEALCRNYFEIISCH